MGAKAPNKPPTPVVRPTASSPPPAAGRNATVTPSPSDLKEAERIVLSGVEGTDSARDLTRSLVQAVATAQAAVRKAEHELCRDEKYAVLQRIVAIHGTVNTPLDIAFGCDAMATLARERMAELTGGPTAENR